MTSWRRALRRAGNRAGLVATTVPLIDFADVGTFTRASEASVFNSSSGVLTCYADDVLRPGVSLSYTLEGAATQLAAASAAWSDAAWDQKSGGQSVTDNAALGPDPTAGSIAEAIDAGADSRIYAQTRTLTDNTFYAGSFFAKGNEANTVGVYLRIKKKDGSNYNGSGSTVVDTTKWQRITGAVDIGAGATTPYLGAITSSAGTTSTWKYLATYMQVEQSAFATSYICDAGGTRALDNLSVASGLNPGDTLSAGKWYFDIKPEYAATDGLDAVLLSVGGSDFVDIRDNSSGQVRVVIGGAPVATVSSINWAAGDTLRITVDAPNGELRVEKNSVLVGTAYASAFTFPTATALQVGALTGLTLPFYGEMSDIYEVVTADGDALLDYTEAAVTRASSAWNYDTRAGATDWYAFTSGEARVLNDGALSVEGSRTNRLLYSNDLTNAAWTLAGSASRTADQGTSIDGTTNADQLTFTAAAADGISQGVTGLTSQSFFSVWLRTTSGTKDVRVQITTSAGTVTTNAAVTTTWQRFQVTNTHISGTVTGRILNDAVGVAGDVLVCYAKIEAATFASEPIPTTGSTVNRAADIITYAGGTPYLMRADVWEVDVWPGWTTPAADSYIFYINANNYLIWLSTGSIRLRVNGVNEVSQSVTVASEYQQVTVKVDFVAEEVTITGATTGDGTYAFGTGGADWAAGTLVVGSTGASSHFFGAISQPRRSS